MATFAKQTFDASTYALSRPTYPKALYDYVFSYHRTGAPSNVKNLASERHETLQSLSPRWDRAVDVGCGTGQATTELAQFRHVVGVDPSAKMLPSAQAHVIRKLGEHAQNLGQFTFKQSAAEDLSFLEDSSVDLTIAAQACHWFDWSMFWPELSRVTRSGGTAAFWGYSEFRLSKYPELAPLINRYSQGSDPEDSLGPHWERPGRTILDNHLVDVPEPPAGLGFASLDRIYFTGDYHSHLPQLSTFPVILRNRTTWNGLTGYLRTFSSLHTFFERNPKDKENPEGDIAERFWKSLMRSASKIDGKDLKPEDEVVMEWPVAVLLIKKI